MEDKVLTDAERKQRREERKKRRKYRLLILLLLLLGTGTMLVTSTYAWFTSNKNVSVSSIKVNIEAKGGIQISADGTNWKSIVKASDLLAVKNSTYAGSTNQIPGALEPVSTAGVVGEDGKFPMYYGTVVVSDSTTNNGEYILTATKETEKAGTDGKFIAFDLFFKVEKDTPIFLVSGSGATTEDTTDTGIKNASRIGFIYLGTAASDATVATIQALNNGAASNAYIWEPNYDVHTDAGVANARDVYGVTTTKEGGSALSYAGIKADITADKDILLGKATATDNADYFASVTPNYTTVQNFTNYVSIFPLSKGVSKVRVYMWVEGQDVDCENSASGGSITFDLKISTEDPNATQTGN